MSLSDLASLGSFVSGFAVLISLVYLGIQVRQAEKNQRALMNQGVISRTIEMALLPAQPALNDVITRAYSGESKFSRNELLSLAAIIRANLLNAQDSYVQHEAGLVDEITFNHNMTAIRGMLTNPINRALWSLFRGTMAPDWTTYVDKVIAETPLASRTDLVARYEAELARIQTTP